MVKDYSQIPLELRMYNSWCVWRYENGEDGSKPTKIPYSAKTGTLASVTDPLTWSSYDEAVATALKSDWYSGIGFILSDKDPYTFIDLDDPWQLNADGSFKFENPNEIYQRQQKVYEEFKSYAERSPSGKGLHIIVKGKVKSGRRRGAIELYSNARYMTMTGDVYRNVPIDNFNGLLDELYEQMGGDKSSEQVFKDQTQKETDEVIIERAGNASNGELFKALFAGKIEGLNYPSQSEADFALVDIIAYYTKNRIQIERIFLASALGQRDKAKRADYMNYMLAKCFDRDLPLIDSDGLRNQFDEKIAAYKAQSIIPQAPETKPRDRSIYQLPPGIIGELAKYIYESAPRPVPEIALAGAIGYIAGLVGRCYNYNNLGLNQYILLLARTGVGKEAMAAGTSRLTTAIQRQVPSIREFTGPAEFSSAQALIKYLNKSPTRSFTSIVGEFGLFISQMSNDYAPTHLQGLKRMLLDLYTKSAQGNVFEPLVYSDKEKNTSVVESPAVTILGESTPETFYTCLNESMIKNGLLPRFLIIEYYGKRPPLNENNGIQPSQHLIESVARIAAHSLGLNSQSKVIEVTETQEAKTMFRGFNEHCDMNANAEESDVRCELWTRGYAKAMKLAALVAVGINNINPVIDENCAEWAIRIVVSDIRNLLGRFDAGEIGVDNNETKQINKLIEAFKEYLIKPWSEVSVKYELSNSKMHSERVIPYTFLNRRLRNIACFSKDKLGPVSAIKRAIQTLVETGDVQEVDKQLRHASYNTTGKCYMLKNTKLIGL